MYVALKIPVGFRLTGPGVVLSVFLVPGGGVNGDGGAVVGAVVVEARLTSGISRP